MSLNHFTVNFANFLKDNSYQLVKFSPQEKGSGVNITVNLSPDNTYHDKTVLFVNSLIKSERADISDFYGRGASDELLSEINKVFHETITTLANERQLIAYIEGLR